MCDGVGDVALVQVYITMSKSEKTESKAAVDLIGAYFGKSGASWIMQVRVRVRLDDESMCARLFSCKGV